ncbi:glycine betaine/L-proline ABC transporter substrate-binding protein ProX [Dichotomicrobium thermohalophilum]|uniref:Glycine betaine/proline transport system substrate-binding protein n=1 Tax=Dichotomicrobium thermohalophilum TaxID=933063 RepID=A0A397Q2P4_9HYPH|nr:glycine betaine/L-proline ABC transporter substrate-binding protein ProX [Dichotomicrobium thermohalophilum]RIA55780.1 glycine betaine/proline transport system substrate-binding protein [Dichotomicrobium thermohalophilum]
MGVFAFLTRFVLCMVVGLALAVGGVAGAVSAQEPGNGKKINMARPTWNTGWFQAEIYKQMLEKLGYDVGELETLDNPVFYRAVGLGDVDLWVNAWFPFANVYEDAFKDGARKIGYVAKGGAMQGYLVDKASAERFGITSIDDFRKPEIRQAFDSNGDGKADLVACPPGWSCELRIAEHLDALDLRDHINPIKAGYSSAMADALGRYKAGEPILFYTWTPNWTVGVLKPGRDVVWIEMPNATEETTHANIQGCVNDPCALGWEANDIRPLANNNFLANNPAVETLLKEARIPIADIFEQNARMHAGEDDPANIVRHASEWIEANADLVNGWLDTARAAAQ